MTLTLGIETSCDETAVAITRGAKIILSNQVSSQIAVHGPFGGVIPELASRLHTEQMIPLIDSALKEANCSLQDLELIAVAYGPGLLGALMVGLQSAKALSYALNIPLIGVNHLEAHLFSATMQENEPVEFPAIGVVVSGGHTALLYMKSLGEYKLIGQTVDDALGEAFDKVAKMMHLPYPGGREIERLSLEGDPSKFPLKPGLVKGRPFDFSFSGIKTKVLYTLFGQDGSIEKTELPYKTKCDMAASFQATVIHDVVRKALLAAKEFDCKTLLLGGGVTNNLSLRKKFAIEAPDLHILWPEPSLTLDNGAMIAGLGAWNFERGEPSSPLSLNPMTRIPFA